MEIPHIDKRRGPQSAEHRAKLSAAQKGKPRPYLLGNQHAAGSGGSSTSFKSGELHVDYVHGHTKHGGWMSPTYRSWMAMKRRCLDPRYHKFKYYGGRGITICEQWLAEGGFANFLADMGERPAGTSLDRIDPDGNYEPGNTRWADRKTQNTNYRKRSHIEQQVLRLHRSLQRDCLRQP